MYGSEMWVTDKNREWKLLAAEMTYGEWCCNLPFYHVSNDILRGRMTTTTSIIDKINDKKLKWYGHLWLMEQGRIPIQAWSWIPPQKNKQWRPYKKWINSIQDKMRKWGLEEENRMWEPAMMLEILTIYIKFQGWKIKVLLHHNKKNSH